MSAGIQLGVCTANGSLGLNALEHVKRFFADPSAHCVGYGKLTIDIPPERESREGTDAVVDAPVGIPPAQYPEPAASKVTAGEVGGAEATAAAAAKASPAGVFLEENPVVGSVHDRDSGVDNGRLTGWSTNYSSCSDILVSDCHHTVCTTARLQCLTLGL